jgi:hypothetical protein
MSFPTPFHKVAFKHYDHRKNTRDTVIFMLDRLNENKIGVLKNIYLEETTFTRHKELRTKWSSWYDEDPLTLTQVNILVFLLNMYCCELARKKRADDLRKQKV